MPVIEIDAKAKDRTAFNDAIARIKSNDPTFTKVKFTRLQPEDAEAIATALSTNSVLTHLDLSYNKINDQGITALAKVLATNTALTYLNLEGMGLTYQKIDFLAKALEINPGIKKLNLSQNSITKAGASALAEALAINTVLTELDLSENNIADEGAIAMARVLSINKILTVVNLGSNDIDDTGAIAIFETLKENIVLTIFHFGNNNFGDKAAATLAEGLGLNRCLSKLHLEYNHLSLEAIIRIIKAINPPLTDLYLNSNKLDNPSAIAIAEVLEAKLITAKIHLSGRNISKRGTDAIAEALRANSIKLNPSHFSVTYKYTEEDLYLDNLEPKLELALIEYPTPLKITIPKAEISLSPGSAYLIGGAFGHFSISPLINCASDTIIGKNPEKPCLSYYTEQFSIANLGSLVATTTYPITNHFKGVSPINNLILSIWVKDLLFNPSAFNLFDPEYSKYVLGCSLKSIASLKVINYLELVPSPEYSTTQNIKLGMLSAIIPSLLNLVATAVYSNLPNLEDSIQSGWELITGDNSAT